LFTSYEFGVYLLLFLVCGLVVLTTAAAALLRGLAGFIRHLVLLPGLVSLLLILWVLICHDSITPFVSAGALRARATVLIVGSSGLRRMGLSEINSLKLQRSGCFSEH
jgi:hypothetical protein